MTQKKKVNFVINIYYETQLHGCHVPRSKYLIKYFESKKHLPSEQVNSFLQS